MPELMDEVGLTAQVLIEKYLVPLFDATTTKFCTYKGKIGDSVTVPDNHTQLRALDIALRLHGAYTSKKSADSAHPGMRVVVEDPLPQRPATENSPPLCLPAPQHR